jgi:hypothetical protein
MTQVVYPKLHCVTVRSLAYGNRHPASVINQNVASLVIRQDFGSGWNHPSL